ncbi:MAG: low molecular weight phosphotyrosine protein phosphatase [Clostridia bacterium]|nr:low molecular weight phosphotyrosine protein phosphatase [Clostridia bacterium]
MTKIMFVCHGNICRSPMAEFIFKDMVAKRGLEDRFYIASSATSSEEIWGAVGNPVYPPAREELAKHGISCGGKRAVRLRADDYDKYDIFVGMDSANIRNMSLIFGSDPENKIRKLNEKDVSDPWYTDDFDVAYKEIYRGCVELLENLKGKEIEK